MSANNTPSDDTEQITTTNNGNVCTICGEPVRSLSWLRAHLIDEHPKAALDWLLDDWERNFRLAMSATGSSTQFGAEHDFMRTADDFTIEVRSAVHTKEGQKWGVICDECDEALLTRRPSHSPGMPVAISQFLRDHRDHETERGTVATNDQVRSLYAEHVHEPNA